MLFRAFLLLTGFGIAVSGGVSTIAYLNLLTTGHTLIDYFIYISKQIECYLLLVGIFIVWTSIYYPDRLDK
jgi:hypothetical protein